MNQKLHALLAVALFTAPALAPTNAVASGNGIAKLVQVTMMKAQHSNEDKLLTNCKASIKVQCKSKIKSSELKR